MSAKYPELRFRCDPVKILAWAERARVLGLDMMPPKIVGRGPKQDAQAAARLVHEVMEGRIPAIPSKLETIPARVRKAEEAILRGNPAESVRIGVEVMKDIRDHVAKRVGLVKVPPAPPPTPEEEAQHRALVAEIESTPVQHISARNPKSRFARVQDISCASPDPEPTTPPAPPASPYSTSHLERHAAEAVASFWWKEKTTAEDPGTVEVKGTIVQTTPRILDLARLAYNAALNARR